MYRKASLTGGHDDFKATEEAIDRALKGAGPLEELYLLRAKLDFRWHRIPQTRQSLEKAPNAAGTLVYEALQADLAFQEGRYDDARNGYEALVKRHGTWDSFARLAYHTFVMGDVARADELYRSAQDQITAREMDLMPGWSCNGGFWNSVAADLKPRWPITSARTRPILAGGRCRNMSRRF